MILDTSFLIDVMNSDEAALAKVDEIEAAGRPQTVPAMTLQELYIGVGASDLPEDERRRIESVLASRPVIPTSEAIARRAGRLDGELRRAGERVNLGDATVAATGLVRDEPVVTGDSKHFSRIPGLAIEGY